MGVLSLTGIGYKFINLITILAGDSLFLLMVYLMLTSFVLGMGIPTTPAYIVVATLGAPALIKAGAPQLVAHMFVFYYAILSFITPPVCVAALRGGCHRRKQGHGDGLYRPQARHRGFHRALHVRLSAALLGIGETPEIIWAAITAIIGVIGIAGGMQSWLLCSTSAWERAFLLIGGLTLIYPGLSTDIIGFGLLFSVGIVQMLRRRRAPIAA